MKLLQALALHGPNVWGTAPVLEVWTTAAGDRPRADNLAAIGDRLVELAGPYLSVHELSLDGAPPAAAHRTLTQWLLALTRKLVSLCGVECAPGRVVDAPGGEVCWIAIPFEDESLVRRALETSSALLTAAIAGTGFDFAPKLRELQSLANDVCLGPSTRAIVEAARARGIPVRRLNVESLVQFGQGAQQRRICTAETDGTGIIAESIAQDKELTKSLLRRVGIPVPKGRPAESQADAWEVACEIGVPVVVKPRDGNHGRGVAIKLSIRERIMAAYDHAAAEGSGVLVEQYVAGTEHRLLVVGNRVVAASRGEPELVVSDGRHTIDQLVDLANLDPRRGDEYARPMCKIRIDPIAVSLLEQQGYEPSSVPAAGTAVVLHRNGEYTTDVTDHLHPDVAARAVLATRMVGLDVAGIDLVAHDISRPLEEQGGMIIEVNAGPGLQMHSEPQVGRARPVGAAIVETLYPDGQSGRIPVVALSQGAGAAVAAQVSAHLLRQSGLTVALACSAGTYVGDRRLASDPRTGAPGPADLFLNPLVEAGVFEISAGAIYTQGLAFDDCDVAVVQPALPAANPQTDALHPADAWRRILIESVSPLGSAVLDAADPDAARLAAFCRGSLLYCHATESHPLVARHRATGGKAVFLRAGAIWAASGEQQFALSRWEGPITPDTTALLAGVAAAWLAGVPIDLLGRGLESLGPLLPAVDGEGLGCELAGPPGRTAENSSATCPDQPRVA